jgi:hypothetical protein
MAFLAAPSHKNVPSQTARWQVATTLRTNNDGDEQNVVGAVS